MKYSRDWLQIKDNISRQLNRKTKLINSQYILDIFDLAFEHHSASDLLIKQIPFLTVTVIEHTGIGAYIHFQSDNQIEKFRLDMDSATNYDIEGNPLELIDGIEIRNPELSILADAIVHLNNGVIDHVEIWNKCGEDYVQTEPAHYELHQMWLDNTKRWTIVR